LERHVGPGLFDYVLVNSNLNYPLPPSAQAAGARHVTFDRDNVANHGVRISMADVVSESPSTPPRFREAQSRDHEADLQEVERLRGRTAV